MYGIRDLSLLNAVRESEVFGRYTLARDNFFEVVNWVAEEEKSIEIESNFNATTLEWSNIPTSFEEVSSVYETAIPVKGVIS